MDPKDKGVFITGAAMGIGRAVVEVLLEKGAKVLFCDCIEDKGKETLEDFRQRFPSSDVDFVMCDVTNEDQLKAAFDAAVKRFGAVDICINNAGILAEFDLTKMIAVNQIAMMRGSMLALEHMRRDKGGRGGVIINTGSLNSFLYDLWGFPVYAGTKHAMKAFTTGWACNPDNEAHGVRWGLVCPGACTTAIIDWAKDDQFYAVGEEKRKFREDFEWMTPRDVAYSFLTYLGDGESNGGMLKIFIEGGVLRQEMWVMDKSKGPCTTVIMKYCKEQAPGLMQ